MPHASRRLGRGLLAPLAILWGLGGLGAGCGDDEDGPAPAPPTRVERQTDGPTAGEAAPGEGNDPASASGRTTRADEGRCPAPRVPLAQRLGTKMAEICHEVDPMGRSEALDRTLTGTWAGEYVGRDEGARPVHFQAELSVRDGNLSGSTSEPNTFAGGYYSDLEADLTGDAFDTRQVVLLKTYRTGAVDHSVLYVGALDEAGTRIEGHWRIGTTWGTFWMQRM